MNTWLFFDEQTLERNPAFKTAYIRKQVYRIYPMFIPFMFNETAMNTLMFQMNTSSENMDSDFARYCLLRLSQQACLSEALRAMGDGEDVSYLSKFPTRHL